MTVIIAAARNGLPGCDPLRWHPSGTRPGRGTPGSPAIARFAADAMALAAAQQCGEHSYILGTPARDDRIELRATREEKRLLDADPLCLVPPLATIAAALHESPAP